MIARTNTISLLGLQPTAITVEVSTTHGIPQLEIVGLPTKAIQEAKERISASFQYVGLKFKRRRTIVNLAPADIRKTSSAGELAIVAALLKYHHFFKYDESKVVFIGELSLDGQVQPVRSAVSLAMAATQLGFEHLVFPSAQKNLLRLITGCELHPIEHITELMGEGLPKKWLPNVDNDTSPKYGAPLLDSVAGHQTAKRALALAAAGHHHLFFSGPPGGGKTILAQALPQLIPNLTTEQALEVTSIHSLIDSVTDISYQAPFRAPHHSASISSMLGGTNQLLPGEISLAHRGVLFLDELPAFSRVVLEGLRQPLTEGSINLHKANNFINYPSKFLLVAAANPCPCGYLGSQQKECHCPPHLLTQYRKKLSGPLLDRLTMQVAINSTQLSTFNEKIPDSFTQTTLKKKVAQVRDHQHISTPQTLLKTIKKQPSLYHYLQHLTENLELSTRSLFSLLSLAQTIQLFDEKNELDQACLAEAAQYRQELRY